MPLTLEDGTGVASADSFVSVNVADGFWLARGDPPGWANLDSDAKEGRLREAAAYLSDEKRLPWTGEPLTWDQALAWPRRGAVRRGLAVPEDVVPEPVKQAQCWLALRGYDLKALGEDAAAAASAANISSQSVGEVSVSYFAPDQLQNQAWRPGQSTAPAELLGIIWPFLRGYEVAPGTLPAIGPLGLFRPWSRFFFPGGPRGDEP